MVHAEICPVCKGTGKIRKKTGYPEPTKTCHGCGGKGWVEVGREEPVFIPKPDNPYPYPTIPFPKPWDRIEVWWA